MRIKPKYLILDVDGVMTTGHFLYSEQGKAMKIFGPDDHDALSLLKNIVAIQFVTGDRKGFNISYKRIVEDMKYPLELVSTIDRIEWIKARYVLEEVIYMGDGIFDHYVMKEVGYAICPSNGDNLAKTHANFVTSRPGGDRAVAEACLHILEKFFTPFDGTVRPDPATKFSGEW
jgi:3-deoxy-D-manno-octulosonate 8-phosphate phosphatase (KDO 8-P phosphatase)